MRLSSVLRSAVRLNKEGLSMALSDGKQQIPRHLPYRWLRDACQCPSCVHPTTRQKLFETSDVPLNIKPSSMSDSVVLDLKGPSQALRVNWSDGHDSQYPLDFLQSYTTMSARDKLHHEDVVKPVLWDLQTVQKSPDLWMDYTSLSDASGKVAAYTQLARYGVLFVRAVPTEQTSDELCDVRHLAELFGEIRPTFYGSMWDVRTRPQSRNVAYTDLNLGLHMDLMYFRHPPKYQILHCLRNNVPGGTSLFVDSFNAASALEPQEFDVLARTPVQFHYMNDGHHLHHAHPTLEVDHLKLTSGAKLDIETLQHVNYSPPFQAPFDPETPVAFYKALQSLSSHLARPAGVLRHRMRPGDAVLFDNRRVLHARTGFGQHAAQDELDMESEFKQAFTQNDRWLKGCYFEADTMNDRRRVLLDSSRK